MVIYLLDAQPLEFFIAFQTVSLANTAAGALYPCIDRSASIVPFSSSELMGKCWKARAKIYVFVRMMECENFQPAQAPAINKQFIRLLEHVSIWLIPAISLVWICFYNHYFITNILTYFSHFSIWTWWSLIGPLLNRMSTKYHFWRYDTKVKSVNGAVAECAFIFKVIYTSSHFYFYFAQLEISDTLIKILLFRLYKM